MKCILSAVVLLFGVVGGLRAQNDFMTVELKNGDMFSFLLSEKPVVTYQDANLVINGSASTSYSIEGIKNYHFTKEDVTGDVSLSSAALRIVNTDNQTIEVQNARPLTAVSLNSVGGVKVLSAFADMNGEATISLPVQQGIYVLSVGDQSFKIIRK